MYKKILLIILCLFTFAIGFTKVEAKKITKDDKKEALEEIIKLFNDKDEEFFEKIDSSLEKDFRKYFGKSKIEIKRVKSIKNINSNEYKINVTFSAESINNISVNFKEDTTENSWSVEGFSCYFTLRFDSELDEYVIVDTDIFDFIGSENITKFAGRIIAFVFIILGLVLLGLGLIAIIIVVVVLIVKNNKKNNTVVQNE